MATFMGYLAAAAGIAGIVKIFMSRRGRLKLPGITFNWG